MSKSWDEIKKDNRRQRVWRIFRSIGIVGAIAFLTLFTGIIPLWPEPNPVPIGVDESREVPPVIDDASEAVTPDTIASEVNSRHMQEISTVDVETTAPPSQDVTPKLEQSSETASTPADSDLSPLKMERDAEAAKAAQQAIAAFERKVKRLKLGDDWLDRHGGEKWRTIEAKIRAAKEAEDPALAIRVCDEASRLLDAALPDMYYAEFQATTLGKKTSETLSQIIEFRGKHAGHPKIPDLEASVERLSSREWLEGAAAQMERASPNDAGFIDGWQPIAGAWLLAGEDAEAREALRRARESLPRMTRVERIVESTIDLCLHPAFDAKLAEPLIKDAARSCGQVSDLWSRSTYYANLAGLAAKLGLQTLSPQLLEKSVAIIKRDGLSHVWKKYVFTQEFRAAAWSEAPGKIQTITEQIERLSYPKPTVNANGYAHAAMAAARRGDRRQFLRSMLMAEIALAPLSHRSSPNYLFTAKIAEANILARRWRAAVIIANNIPDPSIRASLLFRVLQEAPQEVRTGDLPQLFASYGDQRWAVPAVAGYVEHRLRTGEDLFSVIDWIEQLPLTSQRASGFAGIARVANSVTADRTDASDSESVPTPDPDISDVVSLVEAAQEIADSIKSPMDGAFAWLQIARTWHLLGKTLRYEQAVAKVNKRCFDAWAKVWMKRLPARRSFDGTYSDGYSRNKEIEDATVGMIIACHQLLSQMQADLGDADGAMESCLNLANSAGYLFQPDVHYDMYFLHMEALTVRLQSETDVGPDIFSHTGNKPGNFSRAMVAAWSQDIPGLLKAIESLHQKSDGGELARAYCELAILYGKRGNTDGYREARRAALSLITQGRAQKEIKCVLATADAFAGELALAEENLVSGYMPWFGDASRPRSRLSIALAADGQLDRAVQHAGRISEKYPVFRGDAWEAIAKSRYKHETSTRSELTTWAGALNPPSNRVGAFCGLALAAEEAKQK